MKRYYYNNKDYFIDKVNKKVIINPELHQKLLNKECVYPYTNFKYGYKKIGGSSLGDILKSTAFSSPFKAFCNYAYLAPKPLIKKYINAGIAIEPKVIDLIDKTLNKNKKDNEPRYDVRGIKAEDYNYNYFKDYDDLINGVPDGLLYYKNYTVLLEIKTAGETKYSTWLNGVPENYKKQAQLYAYILGIQKYWIITTFLKEEDYFDPENYPINQRRLKKFAFEVNVEEAKDDLEYAKNWYKQFIYKGESPEYNTTRDGELLEYLECENEEQWAALIVKWKKLGKCDPDFEG
ncbi:MAGa7180 family putative nuclease [Mycoplasma phocimorsus]|uniref:MAGa7180 family putative nuclease n=1 Tax=Mycoplasma phocimorsus TaxID=3045839 RepID=UPI0024C09C5C|nr:hypothetical protein [Mycoplasma phocimorsus]MDJ1647359.1 hypothetical protein [Mycoplasma phocimorsus]